MNTVVKDATQTIVRPKMPIARIVLPPEHGSWSLLLEPLVVGFAIASSPAAPWVALMTIGAFMARQPVKTRLVARRNEAAARTALKFIMLFLLLTMVGAAGVAWIADRWAFFPLAVAAPLALQQLVLDISTRGRSLIAELAGAAAISSSVAVIALAGGVGLPSAVALWVIMAGRFIPSILYVRNRLLLEKGKNYERAMPVAAHLLFFLVVTGLALFGLASFLTVAIFGLLSARAVYGLSNGRTGTRTMVIGIREVAFGVLTVASIIVGYYAGF